MLTEVYGNASSIHHFGQAARQKLDEARRQTAALLGAAPEEIVFTSGGTEADNLALLGFGAGAHAITTTVEHPAVLAAAAQLASATLVPVDSRGLVDPDDIRRALRDHTGHGTKIISVMHANNELGAIQPIAEIASIAREAGVAFHSDGVQAAGKIPSRRGRARRDAVLHQRATSSTRPRASARCSCAREPSSRRCFTAVTMSATAGPAQRTSRAPWPSAEPRSG